MSEGKNLVGVDIGASSIKVCEVREKRGSRSLVRFGYHALPPQTIVDGHVMGSGAVVEGLDRLFHKARFRDVALRISGHSVIIKKISMPLMSPAELREQINWEAEQHIPYDVQDVEIDYQVLRRRDSEGQMDVLIVAAKKEEINDLISLASEARLRPRVVDLDAFSIQNCFNALHGDPAQGETVVLLHVGASLTTVNILSDGTTSFTRDIANGGQSITDEIQRQLSISAEEAEAYKCGSSAGLVPREVPRIIQDVVHNLASEIQRSMDFYLATSGEQNISRLCMSGGAATMQALQDAVSDRSGRAVELVDPLRIATVSGRTAGRAEVEQRRAQAVVATGLALRKQKERAS